MVEQWKEIKDCPNYEVSSFGRVRSKNKMLKQQNDLNGYKVISLRLKGKKKNLKVHRLVAQAFIPNPQGKDTVNHISGNKTDNQVENLEWATIQENIRHEFQNNLITFETMSNAQNKLKKPVIKLKNNKLLARYESQMDACRKNGVKKGVISYYCHSHRIDKNGYEWRYE